MTTQAFRAIPHANAAYDQAKRKFDADQSLENAQVLVAAERTLSTLLFGSRDRISAWIKTGRG
ncbi:hypothetical protein KIKIMORA_00940 [Brevundimonas phage vB_BpoS-Kikimora]|uniref:Uncharacterized protein n=1 Tax=Brevundimonas phage vB_BpoS-Kikimora TaxID=2948601 RepID=A0A9E7MRK2_9CAUD|nr:hypothetical protein KIKIMORA_00940 [Brevundimonas phage vB_BpoS-Kikimora]